MMKNYGVRIGIILFLLVDLVVVGLVAKKYMVKPETIEKLHIHGGFKVYDHGVLQDFSADKYMSTAPCAMGDHEETPEEIQKEKGHLHDGVGDVVHLHIKGGTWGDLFKNIRYPIEEKGTVTGYMNGQVVENILKKEVHAYDSVVFIVGDDSQKDAHIAAPVTKEAIISAEQKSENCGT